MIMDQTRDIACSSLLAHVVEILGCSCVHTHVVYMSTTAFHLSCNMQPTLTKEYLLAALQAFMEIDLRDIDEPRRDAVLNEILAAAKDIAARRRVRLHKEVVNRDAPATCAAEARSC